MQGRQDKKAAKRSKHSEQLFLSVICVWYLLHCNFSR